jgi:hypothetical protein
MAARVGKRNGRWGEREKGSENAASARSTHSRLCGWKLRDAEDTENEKTWLARPEAWEPKAFLRKPDCEELFGPFDHAVEVRDDAICFVAVQ